PGSHRATLGPARVFEHRGEPVWRHHLDIVVEEQELFSLRVSNAEVVDRRVVEPVVPSVDLTSRWKRREVLDGVRLGAAVVDDKDFVPVVVGTAPNALY